MYNMYAENQDGVNERLYLGFKETFLPIQGRTFLMVVESKFNPPWCNIVCIFFTFYWNMLILLPEQLIYNDPKKFRSCVEDSLKIGRNFCRKKNSHCEIVCQVSSKSVRYFVFCG